MEFISLILVLIIFGIQKLVEHSDHKEKGYKPNPTAYRRPANDDDRYMDRIFVLDAAANGVFVPGAERVFDNPEDKDDGHYENYEDDYESYSSYDEDAYAEKDFYGSYSYYENPVDETWASNDEPY